VILVLDESELSGTLEHLVETVYGNVITDETGEGVDSDPENDPLSVTHIGSVALDGDPTTQDSFDLAYGTLKISEDGEFSFVPTADIYDVDQVFTYDISDGDGGTDTATVTISLPENTPPVALSEGAEVGAETVNLVMVIDTSGSMEGDRLTLTKDAVTNLINTYGDNLNQIMIVEFNDNASVLTLGGEAWLSASDAIDQIDALEAGGYTDYDDAIAEVQSGYADYGDPTQADSSYVYFLSDGEPNPDQSSNTIGTSEREDWVDFLELKGIDEVYAVGIGDGINQNDPDLADVAWSSTGPDADNVMLVLNENDLSDALVDLAQTVEGNVLSNDFDNDGDPLTVLDVNGQDLSGSELVMNGSFGDLTINPDGSYSYTLNDTVNEGFDIFTYTVSDDHGLTDTANLVIQVNGENGQLIVGTENADILTGTDYADALIGGAGDDSLTAGDGLDFLIGDEGADSFNFSALGGEGDNTILDFDVNQDMLHFYDVLDTNSDGLDASDLLVAVDVVGDDVTLTINNTTSVTLEGINTGASGPFDSASSLQDLIDNGLDVDFHP